MVPDGASGGGLTCAGSAPSAGILLGAGDLSVPTLQTFLLFTNPVVNPTHLSDVCSPQTPHCPKATQCHRYMVLWGRRVAEGARRPAGARAVSPLAFPQVWVQGSGGWGQGASTPQSSVALRSSSAQRQRFAPVVQASRGDDQKARTRA